MQEHVYEGIIEEGAYVLTTDGEPEPERQVRFGWGESPHDDTLRTAIRVLTREIPVRNVMLYADRFAREVLVKLPEDRPWQLTSKDVRRWMAEREFAGTPG